jgi:ATP:ADP antiporter, AAA family
MSFVLKIIHALWGDMSRDEAKKFGILSVTLMLILGNYWLVRVLKNAIFDMFVDFQIYQPWAKLTSLVAMVVFVLIYSKLVDMFSKEKLFYILGTFFGLWLIGLGFFVGHPEYLYVNEGSALYPLVSWIPGRALGWIGYVSLEALTLLVTLFWATVASTTSTESAKKGYGMIVFVTQIGTVAATFFVANYITVLGIPNTVILGGFIVLLVPIMIKIYATVVPHDAIPDKKEDKKPKTGFMEGLILLATRPYVMGVFVVSAAYEIVGTILEFQMNNFARVVYPIKEQWASFIAWNGVCVNILALVFALVGTSFFMRKFGLRFCLIAFPAVIGGIVGSIFLFRYVGGAGDVSIMWSLFAGMVGIKGLSYALNNPTKEVMYIPTSKDIKFKAKGWVDAFGNRTTKGIGSGVNAAFSQSLAQLMFYGTFVSLGIVGFWIIIATMVGGKFEKLQKDKTIID